MCKQYAKMMHFYAKVRNFLNQMIFKTFFSLKNSNGHIHSNTCGLIAPFYAILCEVLKFNDMVLPFEFRD